MSALLLAAGISAAAGGVQTLLGVGKTAKAAKMRKQAQSFFEKNKYDIPDSAKSALDVAERQASSGRMPYEDITRARLGETTASGVSAAKSVGTSSSDILAQMASLYGNQQRQEVQLGEAAGQRYDVNQRYLGSALNTMAGYEEKKWQYNVLYPYQQMMQTAGQLQGQGAKMISDGIGQIGSSAGAYMQGVNLDKQLKIQEGNLFGGSPTPESLQSGTFKLSNNDVNSMNDIANNKSFFPF